MTFTERSLRRPAVFQPDAAGGSSRSRPCRGCCSSSERRGRRASTCRRGSRRALDGAAAVVTFIGHSTFLIQTAAGNILTDPMYSRARQPVAAWSDRGACGSRRSRSTICRRSRSVLLSHNHYDHCDLPTLRRLARRFDPLVVTPLGNGALRAVGRHPPGRGARLVAGRDDRAAADHADARASLLGAHAVRSQPRAVGRIRADASAARRIYFAGDSAYAPLFREIRQRLGPIDLALLPIGAYEPRWFMQRGAHESGGGGAGASRSRRVREHRHALRHVPADQRGDRRAVARARRGAPRPPIPEDRFSTLTPGESFWVR